MIKQVTAQQAYDNCKNTEHTIIDVRTIAECAQGMPQGAINIALEDLKQQTQTQLNTKLSKQQHYYLICHIGIRSKIAAQQLLDLGFKNIYDISNGYAQWQQQNLPIEIPNINSQDLRYNRHYQLSGFGKIAQEKLLNAHVLIIGAGGLGSASALYLAAAGVGTISIIDDDKVQLSNLQRQIIHTTDAIGSLKVDSAKHRLTALNPEIKINPIAKKLDSDNAKQIISQVDIVIDGSDNLATRYLVNDTCIKQQKPLIYAAVYQYEAQISVFDFTENDSPCLRCLFPQTQGFEPENCSTIGVLGVVPGLAGVMQASEAIKLITKIGKPLANKLLICNLLDNSFRTIKYTIDNNCKNH